MKFVEWRTCFDKDGYFLDVSQNGENVLVGRENTNNCRLQKSFAERVYQPVNQVDRWFRMGYDRLERKMRKSSFNGCCMSTSTL